MTFKHVKFEDSPTMRALEKVAREKGLVKPEPLTKKASLVKKADLTPSDNLMENILKLCNGLREQGMVKDASDLETKYLQLKQAQTLYDAHGETGEDLLEEAHPEGSHKLEGVDSAEAVVEDLLDKHDMIEEVAEKKPTSKLSDAASVIKAVKKVLAQGQPQPQLTEWTDPEIAQDWAQYPDKWKKYVNNAIADKAYAALQRAEGGMSRIQQAINLSKQEKETAEHPIWGGWSLMEHTNWIGDLGRALQKANDAQRGMRGRAATVPDLDAMEEGFNEAKGIIASNVTDPEVSRDAQNDVQGGIQMINDLKASVAAWVADQSRLPPGIAKPKKPAAPVGADLGGRIDALEKRIDYYASQLENLRYNAAAKTQGRGYLANWKSRLETLKGVAGQADMKDENEETFKKLSDLVARFNADWIKGK